MLVYGGRGRFVPAVKTENLAMNCRVWAVGHRLCGRISKGQISMRGAVVALLSLIVSVSEVRAEDLQSMQASYDGFAAAFNSDDSARQIGRASCRERV